MTTTAARVLTSSKKLVCGLSVVDVRLQDKIVGWVSEASASGATADVPLRNLHLLLFDAHSKALPLKCLARRPTSMVLVEAVQHSASMQREFVAKHLSSSEGAAPADGPCTLLVAYHSSFKDLLVPSKSKPYNERFLQTILLPDREYFNQACVEESEIATVAVGCLPSPALQRSLFNSLYAQWLVFVHNRVERELGGHFAASQEGKKAGEATKSVYEIADFTLITFLHSTMFAKIVCGKYEPRLSAADSKRPAAVEWRDETAAFAESVDGSQKQSDGPLSFFAKSHRHFSFLFNLLFDVRLLNGWDGFLVRESFAPIPADSKEIGHADKLEKLGIKHSDFYAVSIRPRPFNELCALMEAYGIDLLSDVEEIMRLAFWLTDFTPKFRGTKPFDDELRRLLEVTYVKRVFPTGRIVTDLSPPDFLGAYTAVREHFADASTPATGQRFTAFCDRFLKTTARNYVD